MGNNYLGDLNRDLLALQVMSSKSVERGTHKQHLPTAKLAGLGMLLANLSDPHLGRGMAPSDLQEAVGAAGLSYIIILYYVMLHYITSHYITLHYITLH